MDYLAPGAVLQQYRIVKVLGSGGFSVVYLAQDQMLEKLFAIKEYFPEQFAQRDGASVRANASSADNFVWGKERFREEAQVLARFDHPNVIPVIQIFDANNTAYMVLEYLPGRDFKAWLDEIDGPPSQLELDAVVGPILDALDVIHRNDLLHRDVAPDNIYICNDGTPVLLDFGSAKEAIGQRTRTVSAVVKDGYSPAEQYSTRGSRQGPWTDIYALAATLYRAVTGERPDEATERVLNDQQAPARTAAKANYREGFLAAIDWGLKIAPKDRPQSVAQWRKVLCEDGGTSPSPPTPDGDGALQPGTMLQNYRIVKVLGRGGFSVAYEARDLALEQSLMIKEYFPEQFAMRDGASVRVNASSTDDFVWGKERFTEEARALARFDHPSINRVIQIFEANNTIYMVLQYLTGRDFKAWLGEIDGPPSQLELDRLVDSILGAVQALHRSDVLHRAISPGSLYIRDDGDLVLLVADSVAIPDQPASAKGTGINPDAYSPIELHSSKRGRDGPWTDIYALAATLYHAVTGARPDEATERLLNDQYVSARKAAKAKYRTTFLDAIDWGLKLAPDDRPRSVAIWRDALFAPEIVAPPPVASRGLTTPRQSLLALAVVVPLIATVLLIPFLSTSKQEATPSPSPTQAAKPRPNQNVGINDLCGRALNAGRTDWSATESSKQYGDEARARGFSIAGCRVVLGLPRDVTATPASSPTPAAQPRPLQNAAISDLCHRALNAARNDWATGWQLSESVGEVRARGFSVAGCQVVLGLPRDVTATPAPSPSPSPTPAAQTRPLLNFAISDLCHGALNAARSDWATGWQLSESVGEVRARGLSVGDCRVVLGLPRNLVGTPARIDYASSPDVSIENRCGRALNLAKSDWDTAEPYRKHVDDIRARGFSVGDCRAALGFPRDIPQTPTRAIQPVPPALSIENLCGLALNPSKSDWDTAEQARKHVGELHSRGYSVGGCRVVLGFPRDTPEPPARADQAPSPGLGIENLCGLALNTARNDWQPAGPSLKHVNEVRARGFSVGGCRVVLGLPRDIPSTRPGVTQDEPAAAPRPKPQGQANASCDQMRDTLGCNCALKTGGYIHPNARSPSGFGFRWTDSNAYFTCLHAAGRR